MALDASLRKQLIEARKVILAEIDELECRAKTPAKGGPPDYRGPYAELQKQLHEIDELLGTDEDGDSEDSKAVTTGYFPSADDSAESKAIAPGYVPAQSFDRRRSILTRKAVMDGASVWNLNAIAALGTALGAVTHNFELGIGRASPLEALSRPWQGD